MSIGLLESLILFLSVDFLNNPPVNPQKMSEFQMISKELEKLLLLIRVESRIGSIFRGESDAFSFVGDLFANDSLMDSFIAISWYNGRLIVAESFDSSVISNLKTLNSS